MSDNLERFEEMKKRILLDALAKVPGYLDVNFNLYAGLPKESERNVLSADAKFVRNTVTWLASESYLRMNAIKDTAVYAQVRLSEKGLALAKTLMT